MVRLTKKRWFGLHNSTLKHRTRDGKNSLCGQLRSPQNDGDTTAGPDVDARPCCQICAEYFARDLLKTMAEKCTKRAIA